LFTSSGAVLDDVSEVFNYLTGYSNRKTYRELLVAPVSLRTGMRALIEREIAHAKAGRPARLIFKNNAVTDTGMIRALYAASQAGVPIDLITRGVCCLRPGVPGVSATINVRSVVGRFLEHSRIYYFENGGEPEAFIGSADLMERNLDRRVEVLCPVRDPDIRHHLRHVVLDALLRETDRATRLLPDGEYVRCAPAPGDAPVSSQALLLEHYAQDEL
jgi:polyphosphate kinase